MIGAGNMHLLKLCFRSSASWGVRLIFTCNLLFFLFIFLFLLTERLEQATGVLIGTLFNRALINADSLDTIK